MKARLLWVIAAGFLLASMGAWGEAAPSKRTRLETKEILETDYWLEVAHLAFSPDGKLLASSGINRTNLKKGDILLWDVATAKVVARIPDPRAGQLLFSLDGKLLASWLTEPNPSRIWLWDVASRKRVAIVPRDDDAVLQWMLFSPDSKEITVCESIGRPAKGRLREWSVEKQEYLRSREMLMCPGLVAGYPAVKKPLMIDMYDPNLRRVPFENLCTLREVITGKKVFDCKGERRRWGGGFALDRDETMVASILTLDPVQLWDRATGENIAAFPIQGAGLVLSPDARILAIMYRDGPVFRATARWGIRLYEVPSGRVLDTLTERMPLLPRFAFSPDGRLLAVVEGTTIKLWTVPAAWRKKKEGGATSP